MSANTIGQMEKAESGSDESTLNIEINLRVRSLSFETTQVPPLDTGG